MLSFFEMFHLIEGIDDFRAKFGMPPVKTNIDPTSLIGQEPGVGGAKKITHRLPTRGPVVKTGRDLHGSVTEPINQRDVELNRSGRRPGQSDVGYFNPTKHLQDNNEWLASEILQKIQANPAFMRGGEFSIPQLMPILNLGNANDPMAQMKVKRALQAIAQLPKDSPVSIRNKAGFGGRTEHVYSFKPQGEMSNPGEDINPHGRMENPALKGMGGVGERIPAPMPATSKTIDNTPPALQTLSKLYDELDDMIQSGGGDVTRGRGIYMKMKSMLDDARYEIAKYSDNYPEDAGQWRDMLGEIEQFVRQIPADFGLVAGETPPAIHKPRRRLPHHLAAPQPQRFTMEPDEGPPAAEWRYYSA